MTPVQRSGASTSRVRFGGSLVAAGVILAITVTASGSALAGAVSGLTLAVVGAALIWIAHGGDDRSVARREQLAGIATFAGGGAAVGVTGATMRAAGDPDGTLIGLGGATSVAVATLWWILIRDSGVADTIQAPVQLGDGRREHATVVAMPRSKRVAAAVGTLLVGSASLVVASAMVADGDGRGWLLAAIGAFILLVGGPLQVTAAVRDAWLAVSATGVTVKLRWSHYTIPWEAIDRAGIFEFTTSTRGLRHTHTKLGLAADLHQATGTLRPGARNAGRLGLGADGWSIVFPQTVFDFHIEDVATLINEAHPHPPSR